MSLKLPLQSKAIRPKFQSKKAIFGDEDDDEQHVQDELVVGIEDNKVKEAKPKEKKKLLAINPLPNADWRKMAKHKKELYVPAQALQQDNLPLEEEKVINYGLQVQKKTENNGQLIQEEEIIEQVQVDEQQEKDEIPKSLEERAVEAIIKDSMGQDDDEDNGPKKVIHVDETLAFRDDVKNRPDETTMDDYENIPVEEFGAALLRGLGWNEGEGIGRNRKASPAPSAMPVKQRDALLGLGAKPEDIAKERRHEHKKAAYTFKDTSLFKKISKKKLNDNDEDTDSDHSERSRHSNSSRHSSSSRHGSSSRHSSSRHSSSRHSRHDSRDRSSESSSRRHEDKRDRDSDRRKRRDRDSYSSSDRKRSRSDNYK